MPFMPDDQTNVENEWQGAIKYGPLNFQQLRARIGFDLVKAESNYKNIAWSLGVSCGDQMELDEDLSMAASLIGYGPCSTDTTLTGAWSLNTQGM
jgi:hypothetical protein